MTYPSGWKVSYKRDVMGRVSQMPLTTPGGDSAGNAITNATYEPFGPLYTLTFGNGVNEARHFDLDYRVTSLTDTGTNPLQSLSYNYDANDNVSAIADGVTPGNSQTFGYDVLNRLVNASGAYGSFGWSYDKLGNRTRQTLGAAITSYGYTAGTNRLASITAAGSTTPVSYTSTGNVSAIPTTTGTPNASLIYNSANRLASVTGTQLAITGMVYNAFGQRFSKTSGGTSNYFTHGQDGTLVEENDGGFPIDYVYLNARPCAEIVPSSGKVYLLHDDRLGTPQLATDSTQAVAWTGSYKPFGTASIAGTVTQNLRLPGQFDDAETGWNDNGFRTYAPNLARYIEAGPVGIWAGSNPYSYAVSNPMRFIDPLGLFVDCTVQNPTGATSASERWRTGSSTSFAADQLIGTIGTLSDYAHREQLSSSITKYDVLHRANQIGVPLGQGDVAGAIGKGVGAVVSIFGNVMAAISGGALAAGNLYLTKNLFSSVAAGMAWTLSVSALTDRAGDFTGDAIAEGIRNLGNDESLCPCRSH